MTKNKIKTHSGAKKRFKLTKNGKAKFRRTNRIHRLTQKATKRKRNSRSNRYADDTNIAAIKALLPYK